MRIWMTGFEPFGGMGANPTERLARDLDRVVVAGVSIEARVLPVTLDAVRQFSSEIAHQASRDEGPAILLATGLAAGRTGLAIERVAINCLDFRIPDNDGRTVRDEAVVDEAPAAYFSTLPVRAIADRWHAADVPGYVSNSAGTYLCNALFYLLAHQLNGLAGMRAGFIHVPYTTDIAPTRTQPSLPYEVVLRGARLAIETTVEQMQTSPGSAL